MRQRLRSGQERSPKKSPQFQEKCYPSSLPGQKTVSKNNRTLDIQGHLLRRYLNPQTSPEVRLLGVPFTPILTRYDWRILDVEGETTHTAKTQKRMPPGNCFLPSLKMLGFLLDDDKPLPQLKNENHLNQTFIFGFQMSNFPGCTIKKWCLENKLLLISINFTLYP